jgi:hypothetical protein
MTTEQRSLLEAVVRRSEACKRYAEMCLRSEHTVFLPVVASLGAWNLIRTFFLLCGENLRQDAAAWLFGKLRDDAGMCDLCGQFKDKPTDIVCATCEKQFEDNDRQAEIYEKMTEPTKGRM